MNEISAAINKALSSGVNFYAYRLPNDNTIVFNAAPCLDGANAITGFKIVPFDSYGGEFDTVVIPKQLSVQEFLEYEVGNKQKALSFHFQETTPIDYKQSFSSVINEIKVGNLKKVVLSQINSGTREGIDWAKYFLKLEQCYTNAFVFIFHTTQYGTWIGASPETLARYNSHEFHTMSLAGTIKHGGSNWRKKEINEHEFVTRYIEHVFSDNHIDYRKSGIKTLSAGQLDHLCTEFTAHIESYEMAEKIATALHPTPAICGLPLYKAKKCILVNEKHKRVCYGGYIGPVHTERFDYFVNLRSMHIEGSNFYIFSGGGLTIDSDADEEWEETQNKASTLSALL